jgi:molybdenum cofactor biosynthesis protein B
MRADRNPRSSISRKRPHRVQHPEADHEQLVPGTWYLVPEIWYLRGVSQESHKAEAPRFVSCYVLTVSDTRTEANDTSGKAIVDLLTAAGHVVAGHRIVKDEPGDVERVLLDQLANGNVDVIITTGGTGITSRDSTYEAIDRLLDKRLEGFGELFRMLSFKQIGPAAMMSRATAGVARGKVVVALPGSEGAVRLGMSELLLPELTHLVQQVSK